MIYFIQDTGSHAIKIGVSTDPERRLRSLQTATASKLVLLGVVPGDLSTEAELHRHFADYRLRGEWFRGAPPVLETVRDMIASFPGGSPTPLFDFFVKQKVVHPELCYLVSAAVGFPVTIYWVGGRITGADAPRYQVMPWDDGPFAGKEFWGWYFDNREQLHPSPEAAAIAFVAGWQEWSRQHRPAPAQGVH